MKKRYQVVEREARVASEELTKFLVEEGQLLLPMVGLIEQAECAVDVMGRATVEAVLQLSAEQLAGPKQQGKLSEDREIYWYGKQKGKVTLKERKLRVDKPRLRKKNPEPGEPGEVPVPAYEVTRGDRRLADRMLEILMQGVSTRKYEKVIPAMAEQVGVRKSEVSRETTEAGTRLLKELAERDFSDLEILVVYLDGIQFGKHHVFAAIGVDD